MFWSSYILWLVLFPTFAFAYCSEKDLVSRFAVKTICITGGGAYKYADDVQSILNVRANPYHKL
jgi:hypothetical protein